MRKIWNYFRDSWEDDSGKASSKKLTLLAITINFLIFTWFVRDTVTRDVFIILGFGVAVSIFNITFSNLMTLIKFTLPAMGKSIDNEPRDEEMSQADVKDIIEKHT